MRARLEFDLELPEDRYAFDLHLSAPKLHGALWDLYQYLQSKHVETPDDIYKVRERFFEILNDNGVGDL